MMHTIRVWISIVLLLGAQSCDIVDDPTPASGVIVYDEQSSLKLGAPSILRSARAIDLDILSVEVTLSYPAAAQELGSTQQVGPSGTGGDAFWQLGINVPLNTPFVLSMTWFEPGSQRLDLIRVTREFGGFNSNGRVEFSYDFSATGEFSKLEGAPDYAGFDSDGDSITNLEERLASTDPFVASIDLPMDGVEPLIAVPISLNLRALADDVGAETIALSDAGTSNRSFTATTDSPWLTIEPEAGDIAPLETFDLTVSYSCVDLEGDFAGAITLQSNGVATSVPVQLSCEDVVAPILSAVPPELKLTTQTSSTGTTELTFRNTGNADLSYSLSSNIEWLTTSVTNGLVLPGVEERVEISADCGLAQEVRTGELSIQSDGGNDTVDVILDCESSATVLLVRQQTLNLNAQFEAQATSSFVIQNTGTTALDYTVGVEDDWLIPVPASGTILAESIAVISVSAFCETGVTSRTNELTISSAGGNAALSVTQNCQEPSLPILSDVSPDLLITAQSGENTTSSISLSNSGEATLTYEVVSDSAWLMVGQAVGSISANATATVPVEGQCGNFVGTRNAKISIDSNGGDDSVNVSLTCEGAQLSSVRPPSLDLSAELEQSAQSDLSFSNTGNADLDFTINIDGNWITAQVLEGQVQPGLTQRVAISAVCGSTEVTRSGVVRINSNGGTTTVPITQTCMASSNMAVLANVTPSRSLSAQSGQDARSTISLSNAGTSQLNFQLSSDSTWLTVGAVSGSITADDSVSVSVVAQCSEGSNDSFIGERNGVISVTSNGGNATVPVALNCAAADEPILSGVTQSLSLAAQSGQSDTGAIRFSNSGAALLTYEVSSSATWLSVGANASGTIAADGTRTVSVEGQCGESTGVRNATLTINSDGGNATVPVALNCAAPDEPILSGVTQSLSLAAQSGQSDTGAIRFSNTGTALLTYEVSSSATWLSVGGNASGTIAADGNRTVSVEGQCGESTGVRNATLTINSDGGNATVPVALNCAAPDEPILSGVTQSLSLAAQSGQSDTGAIRFSNTGTALLTYEVSSSATWLSVGGNASGTIAADGNRTVSVEGQCGESTGVRNATLTINSDGGNATVPVALNCAAPDEPILSGVTQSLSLAAQSGQSDTGAIRFSNTGTALLTYEVSSSATWLSVGGNASGTIAADGNRTVSVEGQCGESTGVRNATLTIDSDGGNATVPVALNCTAPDEPILSGVTQSLSLAAQSGQSDTGEISFSNSGTALLTYEVTSSETWLSFVEAGGTASGTIAVDGTRRLSVEGRCGESTSVREATLTITSDGGDDTVPVALNCTTAPRPILSDVTPNLSLTARIGVDVTSRISMSNSGNALLNYTLSSNSPWLSVGSESGSIAVNDSTTVPVVAQCGSIAGDREGEISITSNGGGNASIPVTLTCTAPPAAVLSDVTPNPVTLSADGGQTAQGNLSFSNTGTANLNYSITSSSDWLTTQPAEGRVTAGGQASIRISATCGSVPETRNGTLTIDSNGGDESVRVSLDCNVLIAPKLDNVIRDLSLEQTSPKPASSEFILTNSGNAVLSYQIKSDSSWLSVVPASGSIASDSETQIDVEAQCTDFVGDRTGNLIITSNGGNAEIDVSLTCFGAVLVPELGNIQPTAFDLNAGNQQSDEGILSFSNIGNADMEYSVSSDSDWLCIVNAAGGCRSVDSPGLLSPQSNTKVTILATCPAAVSNISLSGALKISGDGGTAEIPVALTCGQPESQ